MHIVGGFWGSATSLEVASWYIPHIFIYAAWFFYFTFNLGTKLDTSEPISSLMSTQNLTAGKLLLIASQPNATHLFALAVKLRQVGPF